MLKGISLSLFMAGVLAGGLLRSGSPLLTSHKAVNHCSVLLCYSFILNVAIAALLSPLKVPGNVARGNAQSLSMVRNTRNYETIDPQQSSPRVNSWIEQIPPIQRVLVLHVGVVIVTRIRKTVSENQSVCTKKRKKKIGPGHHPRHITITRNGLS